MDMLPNRLRASLAGRYEVEHELGRGGMAVVYLGRDLRHERRVAIKVFEHAGSMSGSGERFLREIRIAAQLQHPNILPVFESGEADGLIYYVMPYVPGASLRERLEREGALPIAEAVRIGCEVAAALDHAHRAGIVHRDIKPDNIMLADGVAVVADFGIARAVEQSGTSLTETGMAVGTPNYMSPEQATANPLIDGRADVYALGCVLYEMLAGAPPFSGPTAQAVMARHTADQVPPLSTVRPEVPPALEYAVVKALAKLPADRWQSGREFADAMLLAERTSGSVKTPEGRWVRLSVAAAMAVVLAMGAWLLFGPDRAGAATTDEIRNVAVLPFSISGDTSRALLAEGLTEGVSTRLFQVDGIGVVSGSRTDRFRDRSADARAIGSELGVSAVLSCRLQTDGNKFRVTAQLIDVATGRSLFQRQFNGELEVNGRLQDIFTVQDAVAGEIVEALRPQLALASRARLARGVRTRDPEAYRLVNDAHRLIYRFTKRTHDSAIVLLRGALRRDSLYADAWVALADAYSWQSSYGAPSADIVLNWRHAIERALALDSTNGYTYMLRAILVAEYEWDLDRGMQDLRRAVRLSPGSADVLSVYAGFLSGAAQSESSLVYARRSVAMDPTHSLSWQQLGVRFLWAGVRDSAVAASRHALQLDSTMVFAYYVLMNQALVEGRRSEGDSLVRGMLLRVETSPASSPGQQIISAGQATAPPRNACSIGCWRHPAGSTWHQSSSVWHGLPSATAPAP